MLGSTSIRPLPTAWICAGAVVMSLFGGLVVVHSARAPQLLAAGFFGVAIIAARRWPRTTTACGLFAMSYPYTSSPDVPKLGVGIGMLVGLLFIVAYLPELQKIKVNGLDIAVLVLAETPAIITFIQGGSFHLTDWLAPRIILPYLGFRLAFTSPAVRQILPPAIVTLGSILSVFGLYEALSGHNPFVALAVQKYADLQPVTTWNIPLYRGGLLRAMSTFGQPIAFGMVLLIPLAFAMSRRGSYRYAAATWLIIAGEGATLSRGPWLGAVLIVLLLSGLNVARTVTLALAALIAAAVGPIHSVLSTSTKAGTVEAGNAHYRVGLLGQAFDHLSLLGHPGIDLATALPNYTDVTSFLTDTSLRTGAVGLVELAIITLLSISAYVRARRAGDPERLAGTVALLGLLVGLLSVTLITSFQFYVWVVVAYVASTYSTAGGNARGFVAAGLWRSPVGREVRTQAM